MKNKTAQRFILCSLLLVLCSCADMFQSKIAYPEKNNSLNDLFQDTAVITKLSRPEQLYAAPYFSSNLIRLSWNGVPGAAYYKIEYAAAAPIPDTDPPVWDEPEDGDYDFLDNYCVGTSYIHQVLGNPLLDAPEYKIRFFYRVSSFNTVAGIEESEPCEPQSAMLFSAPEGLRASGGASVEYVELRWNRAAGADWYEVWKSESPGGTAARLMDRVRGNQNWFFDRVSLNEQGKDFYYMITAENGFGNKSLQTRPAYGFARVFGSPDKPANVRLMDNSGRGHTKNEIKIEWEASDEPDAYYTVYRYSSADSSLTRIKETVDDNFYTDSQGLRPGVYYYYKVLAVVDDVASGRALKSEFSSPDPEGFILSPPNDVVAEKNQNGNVTVKWRPAIGNEGERMQYAYNVYADNSMDGDFTVSVMSGVPAQTDAEGYIRADNLSPPYSFYKVTTVNMAAIESEKSSMVSPAPAAPLIEDVTQYSNWFGFTGDRPNEAANSGGVYPVRITWRKPAEENPAFYHVQRSTRTGAGFSRINDTALPADGPFSEVYFRNADGVYTYIDRNETARTGRKYYYRILSLNQLEQGNFPSDEKIGWGALTHNQYMLEYNRTMSSALKRLTYMYKSGTGALGDETKNGSISGSIHYNASMAGLGARIIIQMTNYADFYIENEPDNGVYFVLNGYSNTSANMSANGSMDGTVNCTGMYPGAVKYDGIEIKGGAAGGGYYEVSPAGFSSGRVPYNLSGL